MTITPAMRSNEKLIAAKAYVDAGWPILIIHGLDKNQKCTCGDRKCSHPGKHPVTQFYPHGVKDADGDIRKIYAAFRKHPTANLATSLVELTVVDIDGPAGQDAIKPLTLGKTVKSQTRRGTHIFFAGELEQSVKLKELDLLSGRGRYVLLPPSTRSDGRRYKWWHLRDEICRLPTDLVQFAESARSRNDTIIRIRAPREGGISLGTRNDTLFRIATSLRYRGLDDQTISRMLQIANDRGCEKPVSRSELSSLVESSGRYKRDTRDLFGAPAQREPQPMEHLWYPYIPMHGVTLLAGDPGSGKSLFAALLCASVSSGGKLPLSKENPPGKRILMLSAEDSWSRTTLPRFKKAGGNIDNVHIMQKFRALDDEVIEALSQEVQAWEPSLVVIDTISAYMGGARDMHRQNEVGEFLAALSDIAERSNAAFLALAHLNKQGSEHPLYRIVGSIGFAASVRSVLFFGADPEQPNQLLLAHGKANSAEKGRTLAFAKVGGGRYDVPKLEILGESEATEWDACRASRGPVGRPNVEQERSISFVLETLSRKPMRWSEVEARAEALAISVGTLNLVRAQLAKEQKIIQQGRGPAARWVLAERKAKQSK